MISSTVSAGYHDVYLGRTGSTSAKKLNSVSGDYGSAILSRDGTMVASSADDAETGYSQIFVASVDNFDNPTQLTTGTDADYFLPIFSQDGNTVAATRYNESNDFALIDVATKNITTVMPPGFTAVWFANITPDNQQLVFEGWATEDNNAAIWISDIDESNPVKLTSLDDLYWDWGPSLSGDGMTIAFLRNGELGPDIYTIPITGESESVSPNQLTDFGYNSGLVYPDRDIAFASAKDNLDDSGYPDIYSMRSNGSGLSRLTENTVDHLAYHFFYVD